MLQDATTREPVDPNAFFYLADAAERCDHPRIALQALLDYRTLTGEERDARRGIAMAERIGNLSMRAQDAKAAVTWYQRALDAGGGTDPVLLVRLAGAQADAGDREAARATVTRAIERDAGNIAARALARQLPVAAFALLHQLRIDPVPQPVSKKIEAEHQQRDRETWKDRQVRRIEQVRPPCIQHRSPAGCRRLDAQTKKAQRCLGDDRAGHAQRGLDDDRRKGRGQDVAKDNSRASRRRAPERRGRSRALGPAEPDRARGARIPPIRSPRARERRS